MNIVWCINSFGIDKVVDNEHYTEEIEYSMNIKWTKMKIELLIININ